jgi:2-polyprenyl-6-methoxyphenol hydroxylase-like FAD-dependent oxidoreductase
MAGLLAARTLADHFEQVTLLERDTFPEPGANRKGVPQGRHVHVVPELGRQIMEGLLPGLTADLTRRGADSVADASLNIRWYHGRGYHQPGASGIRGIAVSRPTLEAAVRACVVALPNVQALEGRSVLGLLATGGRVTGVRLVDRQAGGVEKTIPADLVVDASGRGSRSPAWLEELGYGQPPVSRVQIGLAYASCYYRRRPEHIPGLEGIVVLARPPEKRVAVLLAQDGNRWVVTLGGYLGEHAPAGYQGFLEFARELPTPDIYDVIKDAEPLSEPVAYKFRANQWRHYEKLARFPEGYLVLGDALCSFNPVYAQGMTVAAMEARALGECLAEGRDKLAERFFAAASGIVDIAWSTAVGNDLGYPEVEGPRNPMVRFLNWYLDKVHVAAQHDAQVSIAFLRQINMVAPPPSILHPRVVWRVIKGNLGPHRRKASVHDARRLTHRESTPVHR